MRTDYTPSCTSIETESPHTHPAEGMAQKVARFERPLSPRPCDAAAADALYRRHFDLVFRVCVKHLRNREEAREAAQETFLKAIRALPEFQGLSQTSTWIYRIAVNECLSRIESRRRDREKRERFGDEIRTWEADSSYSEAFAGRIVQPLLENVNPITRNIVWLALGQGLTHAEIASTLGVSRVAITRRIMRFLKQARLQSGIENEVESAWREAA